MEAPGNITSIVMSNETEYEYKISKKVLHNSDSSPIVSGKPRRKVNTLLCEWGGKKSCFMARQCGWFSIQNTYVKIHEFFLLILKVQSYGEPQDKN